MPCCDENGDVRGMCFSRLGDLSQITLEKLLQVKKCPQLCYNLAFWLHNNHSVSEVGSGVLLGVFWRKNKELVQYLELIVPSPNDYWELKKAIKAIEGDDDDDNVCLRVKHKYNEIECGFNCPYKNDWMKEDVDWVKADEIKNRKFKPSRSKYKSRDENGKIIPPTSED
jgi:hypothetical protein